MGGWGVFEVPLESWEINPSSKPANQVGRDDFWLSLVISRSIVSFILFSHLTCVVRLLASGKTRVSTRTWRARVMGKRRADLRDQFLMGKDARALAARHLYCPEKKLWGYDARATWVNDARICGRNFLWEKTRASKFSKFFKIFKIFKIFEFF